MVYAVHRNCCAAILRRQNAVRFCPWYWVAQADSLRCLVTISGISTFSSKGQSVPAHKMRKISGHSRQDARIQKDAKANLTAALCLVAQDRVFNKIHHFSSLSWHIHQTEEGFDVARRNSEQIQFSYFEAQTSNYKPNPIFRFVCKFGLVCQTTNQSQFVGNAS